MAQASSAFFYVLTCEWSELEIPALLRLISNMKTNGTERSGPKDSDMSDKPLRKFIHLRNFCNVLFVVNLTFILFVHHDST